MRVRIFISFLFLFVVSLIVWQFCENNPTNFNEETTGTVTDIDGNTYLTVKIVDQWWMAENLKVTHYQNGDSIPNITNSNGWCNMTIGAFCSYDNIDSNKNIYGNLYNWLAINDNRDIAPISWHVPSDSEWKELEIYIGMIPSETDDTGDRGTNEGSKLAGGLELWCEGYLLNNNAFNTVGFSAFPGGYRSSSGHFFSINYSAYFWSSTEYSSERAYYRNLNWYDSKVFRGCTYKQFGFSVRCVKD